MVSEPEPLDLAFDLLPLPSRTLEGNAVAALKVSPQLVVAQEPIIDVFHDQDGLTAGVQNIVGGIACQHGNLMGSCFARVGTDPALGGWRRVSSYSNS